MAVRFAGIGILLCGWMLGCGASNAKPVAGPASRPLVREASAKSKIAEKLPALPPAPEPDKTIYAKSFINKPAPKFLVEEWLTEEPSRKGKMVLIDFWATWCGPCLQAIPELNRFQRTFPDRLVVIGISDETADEVRAHKGAKIHYAVAIDPKQRMYDELKIRGIPHMILIDPLGIVRWEGFPFLKGHELTEEVLDDLLDTYVP